MIRRHTLFLILGAVFLLGNGVSPKSAELIPDHIDGVELSSIDGWYANIYPWQYIPEWSTVHPVPSLWDPPKWDPFTQKYVPQFQSPAQIIEQARQLEEYGSGADILEFNVCPGNPDYNHWLSTGYLGPGSNIERPFFVLYEHVFGNCNYVELNGPKNMDLPLNRKAFIEDIEFIIKNIVLPNEHRYVTVDGLAVIFMWSVVQMEGDFASLLEEVKSKYPVFFIGSINILALPTLPEFINTLIALDGFMEYATVDIIDKSYGSMINKYMDGARQLRLMINDFEDETGREYLFIPTFQFAYDDTKFPGRIGPQMYPYNLTYLENYAEQILSAMYYVDEEIGMRIFDPFGPFIIYSELVEGGAVIESQCDLAQYPRYRWSGCGTQRLELSKFYFGK